eukprot:gene5258-6392_t
MAFRILRIEVGTQSEVEIVFLRFHGNFVQAVTGVAYSSDGTLLASASKDNTVRTESKAESRQLIGHTDQVHGVAFSPDGNLIASASDDRTARLWDATSGKVLTVLGNHLGTVHAVAFAPHGGTLATSCADCRVRIWNTYTSDLVKVFEGHQAAVYGIDFSPDGTLLASGAWDRALRVWDVGSGEALANGALQGPDREIYDVKFRPDGSEVAAASWDKGVWLFSTTSARDVRPDEGGGGHIGVVYDVAFSPDGNRLASASVDTTVGLWRLAEEGRAARETVLEGHTDRVLAVDFSPDGTLLASVSWDGTGSLWRVAGGDLQAKLCGHTNRVIGVAFSPDSRWLASASLDQTVRLWDSQSGAELGRLEGHSGAVFGVQFGPCGDVLASASADRTICLWDTATRSAKARLLGHSDKVRRAVFSPSGALLASASCDCTVGLWDAARGELLAMLEGHRRDVFGVAFSPDGELLASAAWDGTVRLWNVIGRTVCAVMEGHRDAVLTVAFHPSGKYMASGGFVDGVRLWDIPSAEDRPPQNTERSAHSTEVAPSLRLLDAGGEQGGGQADEGWFEPNGRSLPRLDPDEDGAWRAEAQALDDLATLQHLSVAEQQFVLHSGVSVSFLIGFEKWLRGRYPGRQLSTKEVVEMVVIPATREAACRYIALPQMRGDVGRPTFFLSHMWAGQFSKLLPLTLCEISIETGVLDMCVDLWKIKGCKNDIFAINQHGGMEGAMGADLKLLQEVLRCTHQGTLLVMDHVHMNGIDMLPIGRAWCIFEIWSTLHLRGEAFLHLEEGNLDPKVWSRVVGDLAIEHCYAWAPEDKDMILSSVRETIGIPALNHRVKVLFILRPLFMEASDSFFLNERRDFDLNLGLFDDWLMQTWRPGRVLWISGPPGGGKSSVFGEIVRRSQRGHQPASVPEGCPATFALLFFAVRHDDVRRREALLIIRTLAHQLFLAFPHQLGPYYSTLRVDQINQIRSVGDLFELLLREPIMAHVSCAERIVIFLDAVDEGLEAFLEDTAAWMQRCRHNQVLRLLCLQLRQLPPNVSIAFTSRSLSGDRSPLEYIERMIAGYEPSAVTRVTVAQFFTPSGSSALACHPHLPGKATLSTRQSYTPEQPLIDAATGAEDVTALGAQTDGDSNMMRRRILHELRAINVSPNYAAYAQMEDLENRSLNQLYSLYMAECEKKWGSLTRLVELLPVLAASREPLAVSQLIAIGFPDAAATVRLAGFLFHISESFKVAVVHKSVLEFFTSETDAAAFHVDVLKGHQILFNALM